MNNSTIRWTALVCILATCGLLATWMLGGAEADSRQPMVYVCLETQQVMTAPPQPTPAINPHTGRRTLMPGMYCSACRAWTAAPPWDVLQRSPQAALCRTHQQPRSFDGPLPDGVQSVDEPAP